MIERARLLADLQRLLRTIEADLRERLVEVPALATHAQAEHARARAAGRTAEAYEAWREDYLTQGAVAWILATVFVRFMEDGGLVPTPRLAGPGDALGLARDHHTHYFQQHPTETDREYLLFAFGEVARLKAAAPLFDREHNALWSLTLSADGATALIDFWRRVDPATGLLVHDFSGVESTSFLGDLYQDLSESARKTYALLQTPDFVVDFILDRTLEPAIAEFGYGEVRLIDPACGSGHFLIAAFRRLFDRAIRKEPGSNPRALAQRVLDAVHGVDVNPFAVAIARFRLVIEALRACGIARLSDAPGFRVNVAAGDSLLHGPRPGDLGLRQRFLIGEDPLRHLYETEDAEELRRILGRRYHVVVGNPPDITVKDKALSTAYRERFAACLGKYALTVPFMERFFDLCLAPGPESDALEPAGYVGQITSNSFMKREFGKKLIEDFLPRWDLTHVIDTSGAYIPGHGTPTVILIGRGRRPVASTLRAVLGIRGEPAVPEDAAKGLVWSAIRAQVDDAGSTSEYVSATDVERARFARHPWSIGGGGAAELKARLDGVGGALGSIVLEVGITAVTGEDDVYVVPPHMRSRAMRLDCLVALCTGDKIRDWSLAELHQAVWPYGHDFVLRPLSEIVEVARWLWVARAHLGRRKRFGTPMLERGLTWYEWQELYRDKLRTPLSIAFAEVATHNHFVLDRGGKVFKQTAPVIKLAPEATEGDHLGLLGLLNSSTACFWLKQSCHCKGIRGEGGGITAEGWEQFYQFNATKLGAFPVPARRPLALARALTEAADTLLTNAPGSIASRQMPTREALADGNARYDAARLAAIGLQEELDWQCYRLYGLVDDDLGLELEPGAAPPPLRLGERAFEIVLARLVAAGEESTTWFERHGSVALTELPDHWPQAYRRLVERRIECIEANPEIALIERPEHKRRWNTESWADQEQRALRDWLLARLEDRRSWPEPALVSTARLADRAREDAEFMAVAALHAGARAGDFDVGTALRDLVLSEGVPFLPALRYKESGLVKRRIWEKTWDRQRLEDAIDAREPDTDKAKAAKQVEVGDIPVPPRYGSADFRRPEYWRHRGKLDVPKERFILYPHAERDADPSPVVGWAGWDHLEQARALSAYCLDMKEREGWPAARLAPLLAGFLELLPWLKQWHNQTDPEFGFGMGDYFAQFLDQQCSALGLTTEALGKWQPPSGAAGRKGAKAKAKEGGM